MNIFNKQYSWLVGGLLFVVVGLFLFTALVGKYIVTGDQLSYNYAEILFVYVSLFVSGALLFQGIRHLESKLGFALITVSAVIFLNTFRFYEPVWFHLYSIILVAICSVLVGMLYEKNITKIRTPALRRGFKVGLICGAVVLFLYTLSTKLEPLLGSNFFIDSIYYIGATMTFICIGAFFAVIAMLFLGCATIMDWGFPLPPYCYYLNPFMDALMILVQLIAYAYIGFFVARIISRFRKRV